MNLAIFLLDWRFYLAAVVVAAIIILLDARDN